MVGRVTAANTNSEMATAGHFRSELVLGSLTGRDAAEASIVHKLAGSNGEKTALQVYAADDERRVPSCDNTQFPCVTLSAAEGQRIRFVAYHQREPAICEVNQFA